jgi:hypothetical protein
MFNLFKKPMPDLKKFMEVLRVNKKEYYGFSENQPISLPDKVDDCDSAIYGVIYFFMGAIGKPVNILGTGNEYIGKKSIVFVNIQIEETGLTPPPQYKMFFDVSNCGKTNDYTSGLGPATNYADSNGKRGLEGGSLTNPNGYKTRIKLGRLDKN